MSDWEDAPDSVAIRFPKSEAALAGFGLLHPVDQARQDELDRSPANIAALEQELKDPSYKRPEMAAAYAKVKAEHARLTGGKTPSGGWEDAPDSWEDAADGWEDAPDSGALVHAGKRIVGGVAAASDLVGGMAGAAVGGVHGLGTLLTGGSLADAVHNIEDTSSKFMLGQQLQDPEIKKSYETGMKPLEYLLDKANEAGGYVAEKTGSPVLGTAANVALQLGVPVLGAKGLGVVGRATIKVPPTVAERGGIVSTEGNALVDRLTLKPERSGERPTTSELRPEQNSPEGIPYEKAERPLEGTPESARIHPDQDPLSIRPEQVDQLPEVDFYADKGRDLGVQVDNLITDKQKPVERTAPEAAKADLEAQPGKLFEDRNLAEVQKGKEIEEAYKQKEAQELAERGEAPPVRSVEEASLLEPSQRGPVMEKMGQTRMGRGERGAVNFGRGEDLSKRIETLKDNLLNTERSIDNIREGMTVRLMNGKTGVVSKIVDGRYQVTGNGFKDSVPRQGIDYAYKPAAALSESFKKAAAKSQGGALNFGAFMRDKKPLREIKFDEGTTEDLIRKALKQSDDPTEFSTALRTMVEDKDINARAGELWAAKEQILSKDKPSEFSKLSKIDRQQTADVTRDAHTMMKEEGIKALTKKDDISRAARFGNVSSVQTLIHRGPAGKVLNWVHSNVNDIINQSLHLFKELSVDGKKYEDLSFRSRSRIMRVVLDFDGLSNHELVEAGLQWATPEMLAKRGLSNKEILAYQALTDSLDKAYRLNAETMRMDGKEPPPQIPGWFPHQWAGSYRVILRNGAGTDFHMKAFNTRYFAQRYLNKAKYDFEARLEEPTAEIGSNDIAGVTIQALEVFKNRNTLDKVLLDKLNRLDKWSQQGQIRSMLERKANLGGHIAEGWKGEWLSSKLDRGIQAAYLKYMEDTTKAWANSKIAKQIKEPLNEYRDLFKETPNLMHAIDEHVARAVGKPVNHLKIVDETSRAIAVWSGLPPNAVRGYVQFMNKKMAELKLIFPNPAFIFVNTFQALTGFESLVRIHTERSIAKQPTASPLKSTAVLLREWVSFGKQGKWSPEYEAALKWLKDNNKIDNYQADMIDVENVVSPYNKLNPMKYSKDLLKAIEEHNRTASALSFYSYFREVMPPRQALEAAALHMDTVMGNYNAHQASGMFTDLGVLGQSARLFHLLPMTIYGRMAMNIRLVTDTVRTMKENGHSPADIAKSMAPFAAMLGTFYMLAGSQGLPGYQEWDAFARSMNAWVKPDNALPRSGDLARRIGLNEPQIYGYLGHVTGVNIGPSLNAPAVGDIGSMPFLDATGAAIQAGGVVKDMITGTPNMETAYKAGRTLLPPMVTPWLEEWVASKNNGVYPATNKLEGEYKRNDQEKLLTRATGKRSIAEANQREINSLEKYYEKVDQAWKDEQSDKLYQMASGINPSRESIMKMAQKMVAAKRGFDGDSIVDGLEERMFKGKTDAATRNKLKLANMDNAAEMARRKEIMDGLRQYFKANGH